MITQQRMQARTTARVDSDRSDAPAPVPAPELEAPSAASDLKLLSDDELERLAHFARVDTRTLEIEAERCETEARIAAQAFQTSPSAESMAAKEVARQLAANAAEAAKQGALAATPVLAEQVRRKGKVRLTEMRARFLSFRGEAEASAQRIAVAHEALAELLKKELTFLGTEMRERNAIVHELADLERRHGDGSSHRPLKFQGALDIIAARLTERCGSASSPNSERAGFAQLTHFQRTGALCIAESRIAFPSPISAELV